MAKDARRDRRALGGSDSRMGGGGRRPEEEGCSTKWGPFDDDLGAGFLSRRASRLPMDDVVDVFFGADDDDTKGLKGST
jgi:hypothetical protein